MRCGRSKSRGSGPPAILSEQSRHRAVLLGLVPLLLAGQAAARVTLLAPVSPTCITSPFGPRALVVPIAGTAHPGVDLRAAAGASVRAAAAGTVTAIRRLGLAGLSVTLRHVDGSTTFYGHLGSLTPALALGQSAVAAGALLGRVGRTGMSLGPHLYFAVAVDGTPVDPEPLLHLPRCPA